MEGKDGTSSEYGGKKGKQVAYAIATQQAHSLGKSPKGFRTPSGVATAKRKFDDPKEYQKTARVYEILKEALPFGLTGIAGGYKAGRTLASATAEEVAPEGRKIRSGTFAKGLAMLTAPLGSIGALSLSHKHKLPERVLREVYRRYPQGLTGIDQPIIRAGIPLAVAVGGGALAGLLTGGLVGGAQSLRGPKKPREEEKRGSVPRALVLFPRRNDVLNKLAAELVGSPPPMPMVSTTMTPQPQPQARQSLTQPDPRSLKSKAAPRYSMSHSYSAGPTQGMGTAAKNVPPPAVKS